MFTVLSWAEFNSIRNKLQTVNSLKGLLELFESNIDEGESFNVPPNEDTNLKFKTEQVRNFTS